MGLAQVRNTFVEAGVSLKPLEVLDVAVSGLAAASVPRPPLEVVELLFA